MTWKIMSIDHSALKIWNSEISSTNANANHRNSNFATHFIVSKQTLTDQREKKLIFFLVGFVGLI